MPHPEDTIPTHPCGCPRKPGHLGCSVHVVHLAPGFRVARERRYERETGTIIRNDGEAGKDILVQVDGWPDLLEWWDSTTLLAVL